MKLNLLTVLTCLIGGSAYAHAHAHAHEELHNAYIIEHKSEIVGKSDDIVTIISGQIDNGPIIYPKDSDENESLAQTRTKRN